MKKKLDGSITRIIIYVVLIVCCSAAFIKQPSVPALIPICLFLIVPPINYAVNLIASRFVEISVRSGTSCRRNDPKKGEHEAVYCVCSVRLLNRAIVPLPFVLCTFSFKNRLNGEQKVTDICCRASALAECTTQFNISNSHTGCVSVQLVRAQIMDIFGILPVRVKCTDTDTVEARCIFLPKVTETDFVNEKRFSPDSDSCDYAPGKRGSDLSEVFQLRQYEEGDPIKHIHWKASCKTGGLIVREGSFPIVHSLLILMDVSGCTADECDAICDAVASVCSALHDAGSAFTLLRIKAGQVEFCDVPPETELLPAIEWLTEYEPCNSAFADYVLRNGAPEYGKIIFVGKKYEGSAADFCCASETEVLKVSNGIATQKMPSKALETLKYNVVYEKNG